MYHLVDWISFTVNSPQDQLGRVNYLDPNNRHIVRRQVLAQLYQKVGKDVMNKLFGALPINEESGRFPYKYSLVDDVSKAHVYFDPQIDNILVEVSGFGCRLLQESNLVESVCATVSTNCTRIDVSADLRTDISPVEWLEGGYNNRYASTSRHQSSNGITCYVGSPKSDRRAAVYRYFEPHPRHEFLRVEHRFRRDSAHQMAEYVGKHGIGKAVAMAGQMFEWEHPLWQPAELELEALPKLEIEVRDGNVARWLLTQVFPAMRRYERQGVIPDLKAFVQTHLFEDDES